MFGIRGAPERRKGEEGGFFLVLFFVEFFCDAERGAEGGRGVAPWRRSANVFRPRAA